MTRALTLLGWLCIALDVVAAAGLYASRGGDAATRGIGPGLGVVLAALAALAALLLWAGRAPDRTLLALAGGVLAAAPLALAVTLTVSRNGLALIYPSLRDRQVPREAAPQYAFPDAATREAAMAIVMNDYARLDTLLHATPAPDLTARDERGVTLLGLATQAAIMDGGAMRDLDGLRLLLAAGARPRPDDLGPGESVMERLVGDRNERQPIALGMLLDAGLDPNSPLQDHGQPVLFHPALAPEAARLLLAHGADPKARVTTGGRDDWSPVTYQADLRRWATALALVQGGVPADHGAPPGSVLARVLGNGESRTTDQERADPAYRAFLAAVHR